MADNFTRAAANSSTLATDLYVPFIDFATDGVADFTDALILPVTGTISLTIQAYWTGGAPGDVTMRMRRNFSATDLDTDTVASVSATTLTTFSLSSGGWVAGDALHLTYSQTTNGGGVVFIIQW